MSDYETMNDKNEILDDDLLLQLNRQAKQASNTDQDYMDESSMGGGSQRPNMMDMGGQASGHSFQPSGKRSGPSGGNESPNIDMLMDISLNVTVELGRSKMMLREVLELAHGSVVELDRLAGDPVDVFVNNRLIARGEVVVVDDKFGVRIIELANKNGKLTGTL
ncbi:MAG: flagellar motor switch protein FliN [Chloroflexi bacterium HGW-Chloroflexi-10]|nr:MAG: flagellar motor switch protein FliN [Chloroflexi bacterium HGW-Chloroflexi-10]